MKADRAWMLYDVANSAYVLLAATLIPIYFSTYLDAAGITQETGTLSYMALTGCITTIAMFFIGPALGGLSDRSGWRKPIFVATVLTGSIICSILWAPKLLPATAAWIVFLILYMVSKMAFNASIVISDSMLNDITTDEEMDDVSAKAYSMGYIGSCIPFLISLVILLLSDMFDFGPKLWSSELAMIASLIITAAWWLLISVPLIRTYKQIRCNDEKIVVKEKLHGFMEALREIKRNRAMLLFMLAFFFYIDGVYTIIDLAAAYGSTVLGDGSTISILVALLITQIVAFPSTLFFSKLSQKYGTHNIIMIGIVGYIVVALIALFLNSAIEFFALAFIVGLFQGAIQAMSRSYFGRMVPKERTGQFFGIMDIFGKGATFIGALLVFVFLNVFNHYQVVPGVLLIMFGIGLFLFICSVKIHNYDVRRVKH